MSCCSLFFSFFLNKMKQLLFSTLGSVRSINIIYTVSTISHQQLSTSKEFCFRCIKMTPGIQTTLCYIRERWIIQTPTSPSFLITEYPRAGSNFLTFTYYLKISKTSGDSVMLFFFLSLVKRTGCSQVFAMHLVHDFSSCTSSKRHQIDSVRNWRCTQTLPAWILACVVCSSRIYLLGRHQRYVLSRNIHTRGTPGLGVLWVQHCKAAHSHTWMNYL